MILNAFRRIIKRASACWQPTLLFILTFLLIRIGLNTGFPLTTHADEHDIINPVVNMTQTGVLDTVNYIRPDQFLYFTNYAILNIASYLKFGTNLAEGIEQNRFFFYSVGRHWIALLGAFIPVVGWAIGKTYKELNFSLAAGVVLAFFPLYTFNAKYITPDIPITLFTLLVIYFSQKYFYSGSPKAITLAALFAAFNTIEKYPGVLSVFIILISVLLRWRFNAESSDEPVLNNIFSALLLYLAFLLLLGPNLFIHSDKVQQALISESRSSHLGADGLSWLGNMGFYIRIFSKHTNILYSLFLPLGLVLLVRYRDYVGLLYFYGLGYWVAISKLGLHWERWSLPMMITPLLLIAIGIAGAYQFAKKSKLLQAALISIIVLGTGLQFLDSLAIGIRLGYTDTRVVALEYCHLNGILREDSEIEGYTPFLPGRPSLLYTIPKERLEKAKYIILSSIMYDRFYAKPDQYPDAIAVYEWVRGERELIYEVKPSPIPDTLSEKLEAAADYISRKITGEPPNPTLLTGPTIQIYERD